MQIGSMEIGSMEIGSREIGSGEVGNRTEHGFERVGNRGGHYVKEVRLE